VDIRKGKMEEAVPLLPALEAKGKNYNRLKTIGFFYRKYEDRKYTSNLPG
jgi:hypothetical protein